MDLQGRELKFTLAGNDVQLLQTELTQIGLPVPDAERKNANFGEGPRRRSLSSKRIMDCSRPAKSMRRPREPSILWSRR